jgi:osmotically-inducible protein OsmY
VKSSIEAALQRRARRAAKAIQVDVEGHTVKLSGSVDSWAERHAVERTALFAPGVAKVENKLNVLPYA